MLTGLSTLGPNRLPLRQAPLALLLVAAAVFLGPCRGVRPAGAPPTTATAPVITPAADTSATVPPVTISPLPGTPDAMPQTQISFLGAPAPDLRDVKVVGSRSGVHSGRLESYESALGASFLPARRFAEGEQVTVSAIVQAGKSVRRISSSFTIGQPYKLPKERRKGQPKGTAAQVQSFHSQPKLSPPSVEVTVAAANPALGDIFISPDSGPGQEGAMIVEPSGQLAWFKPMPAGTDAMDFREQQYEGKPVLTWWQGEVIDGHGQGEDVIYSDSYAPVATIHGGNGLYADLHEFDVTPSGDALITTYEPVHWDLSSVGGPRHGLINDCVMQEIDIKTGLVMFEWHALGHVDIKDSHARIPHLESTVYDFFHLNSIQQESNGNFLIDSRNTWAAYMIDHNNGSVLWRLGGRRSSFTLGPGVHFAWQHDAEMLPDGEISIFDDEDTPAEAKSSRAITVALDYAKHNATLTRQLTHPGLNILTESQGNAQELPGQEEFVGWGQAGYSSQFSSTGALTFDMHLPPGDSSYRSYRFPWSATPTTGPSLAVTAGNGATSAVYASWNGATAVASWTVIAGASPAQLTPVGTFPRSGFETGMTVGSTGPYFAVQALGSEGQVLGTSAAVKS